VLVEITTSGRDAAIDPSKYFFLHGAVLEDRFNDEVSIGDRFLNRGSGAHTCSQPLRASRRDQLAALMSGSSSQQGLKSGGRTICGYVN
jgi:hypothetical protein